MVADSSDTTNNANDFTIEDNILKGKVVPMNYGYTSVGKLLFEKFDQKPDAIGQVDTVTGQEDTFAAMKERSVRCALWLRKQGVKPGDVVAICTKNHTDAFAPCVAALYVGTFFNPWDPEMNLETARHFMKLTEPKMMFAHADVVEMVLEAAKLEGHQLQTIVFGKYPGLQSFSEILEGHEPAEIAGFRCAEIDDVLATAAVMFSSGTTGLPKGVQVNHIALLSQLLDDRLSVKNTVPLWFSSLYWISGVLLTFSAITSATKRIICADFDEEYACKAIEKYKASWIFLGSSMANRMLRAGFIPKYDLSSLQIMFVGGAVFSQDSQDELKRLLPEAVVLQGYGMTEVGGIITSQRPQHKPGSCGIPTKNTQLKIVDTDTGRTLGPNQSGELYVKMPTMTTGYYRNPQATKDTIDSEGWLHTGDLVYYDEDGEVFVLERLKELIKYRERHVSPAEVEIVVQRIPGVLEVAVVGVPHALDGDHPMCFVTTVPGAKITANDVMDFVAKTMSDHNKLRAGVKFLDSLPHTPSGKVSRKELRALAKELCAK